MVWALVSFFQSPSAMASDAVCANPQSSSEIALCEDPHLMGKNLQIQNVLRLFLDDPQDVFPEWLQMEYAHHLIARDECGESFRCLESVLVEYLDQLNRTYLERGENPLADYQDVRFSLHQSQDSPGNDILRWNNPRNFGWSQRLCQLRCAANAQCAGVGYDPMQQLDNVFGYCTMKHAVKRSLSNWTPQGVFLIKE
jgi:hypothetical protein